MLVTTELLIGAPSRGKCIPPQHQCWGRKGAQALFLEHTPRSFCRSWANHLLGAHFPSWDLSVLPLKLGWFISMCLKGAQGALCWGCSPLPTSHGAGLRGVGLFGYRPCGSRQHLLPSSSRPVPQGLGEALLTRPGEGVAHVTLLAAALLCAASSGGRCTAERPHPSADAAWPPGNGAEPRAARASSPSLWHGEPGADGAARGCDAPGAPTVLGVWGEAQCCGRTARCKHPRLSWPAAVDSARFPSLREEKASAHPSGCGSRRAGGPGGRCTRHCSVPWSCGGWEVDRGP